ncbi:hypothetical protein [Oryzibacter oryziterrae]|uniref:hypothetical protein n=1 Tax=Oryzibacter oryziterrae TaxID=2766474 RepID=UPI001F2A82F7|nr:hypothetical protein [Oryzibacter oryziterrae]
MSAVACRGLAALGLALVLSACIPTDRPRPYAHLPAVEDQKKDIAVLRNRGVINYETAARRQFEFERANYALTDAELGLWHTAFLYARQYDRREITLQDYQARIATLFDGYAVKP